MRTRMLVCLVGVLLFGAAFGDDVASFRADLQKTFVKLSTAFKAHDRVAFEKADQAFLAPEYFQVTIKGKKLERRVAIQTEVSQLLFVTHVDKIGMELKNVRVKGKSGWTNSNFTLEGTIPVPNSQNKATSIRVWTSADDEYRKVGNRWLTVKSVTVGQKVWLDGKLIPNP